MPVRFGEGRLETDWLRYYQECILASQKHEQYRAGRLLYCGETVCLTLDVMNLSVNNVKSTITKITEDSHTFSKMADFSKFC